ncbi:hypothetical protein CLIB1423_18S02608 [[Candida] railenensis]|uniref:Origin recognition complex subunit 3 n=1 Tax=[Candida] railenensis TaxID=45579 RepID=A0A9P0W084_9ASCO|nr:hypothetical protein CLIB1423_18S02608 [[Candida] railenensis]
MKRDVDSQSTHYWLKRPKKSSLKASSYPHKVHHEAAPQTCPDCPLSILIGGAEPTEHVKLRYDLLQSTWNVQQQKIEKILQNANIELFDNLVKFISTSQRLDSTITRGKLPVGFLQLGSNVANNLRIFKEFGQYLRESQEESDLDYRIVNLSSRTCANIKATIREIVKQVTEDNVKEGEDEEDEEEDEEEEEEDDDDEDDQEKAEEDDENGTKAEKTTKKYHGKISYDFDIIHEWCEEYFAGEGKNASTTNLRIVIVIQDSDALPNQLLNQVLKLIHSYSKLIPMKLIVGLSSINSNISTWLNNNLSNELRIGIKGSLFRTVDNKMLGHSICNDLFLRYSSEEEDTHEISLDSLMLSPDLISTILNRFQNSNNSIDSLVSSFKLSYMVYFYQSPLVSLLSPKFNGKFLHLYTDLLRKLPSFKRCIEIKLDQSEGDEDKEKTHQEIVDLLTQDGPLMDVFHESVKKSKLEKLMLINTMNVLYHLQDRKKFKNFKEKIDIYQLIATRQIFSSFYLTNLFNSISMITTEQIRFLTEELPTKIGNIVDTNFEQYQNDIRKLENGSDRREKFLKYTKRYLKIYLAHKQLPLYEVFTILGGSVQPAKMEVLEEKSKNLIIDLLRPELRAILEMGLEDSRSYLSNDLIQEELGSPISLRDPQPIITKLFQVYKDAPVNINIYDFYCAFRQTFEKHRDMTYLIDSITNDNIGSLSPLVADLEEIRDGKDTKDEQWNKISFAWFLQGCFELIQMGIVKEKPKGDYLEKVIWKGV